MPDAARLGAAGPISRSPLFVIPSDGKNVGHDGIWGQRRFGARRKAEAKAQAGDEPSAFFCKSSGVRVKTLEPDSASHVAMIYIPDLDSIRFSPLACEAVARGPGEFLPNGLISLPNSSRISHGLSRRPLNKFELLLTIYFKIQKRA